MNGPALLRIASLRKTYRDVVAVDDVTLDVAPGSLTALVGPSGCGKSTLLACIAGLVEPDSGEVELDGRSLADEAAQHRPVSLVFQKPLLFPHLSVEENVAFGLRMRRVPRPERNRRVEAMLAEVRLDELAARRVGELSGGQEQRVALARALVLEPRLLLLDEPFSQLDAALRTEMRALVRRLHDANGLTTVFVTHDQAEAVEIADDIALLLDGRLAGHADPERFYRDPPSLAAARFFGVGNEIAGAVSGGVFRAADLVVHAVAPEGRAVPDGPAVLVVRPEAVRLGDESGAIAGVLVAARFAGTHLACRVRTKLGEIGVHVPLGQALEVGSAVGVVLPGPSCTVFGVDPLAADGA